MLIIDGHNLIGRMGGAGLEDEARGREELLRRILALKGSGGEEVVVVFDGNRPERTQGVSTGRVRVVHSAGGSSADEEIIARLDSRGGRGVTLVTSDRELASRARARGADVTSSDAFAARLKTSSHFSDQPKKPNPDAADVDYWLDRFSPPRKR